MRLFRNPRTIQAKSVRRFVKKPLYGIAFRNRWNIPRGLPTAPNRIRNAENDTKGTNKQNSAADPCRRKQDKKSPKSIKKAIEKAEHTTTSAPLL